MDLMKRASQDSSSPEERAAERAERVNEAMDRVAYARLRAAAGAAKTARQRLVWIQRAADVVGRAVEDSGAVACRRGCHHCCHIAVQVTQVEAEAIAGYARRPINRSPSGAVSAADASTWEQLEALMMEKRAADEARFSGHRCPFLGGGGDCTIYEVRPQACRLHFSLGDDDSACRLSGEQGGTTGGSMFMLNNLSMKVSDAAVLGMHQRIADLRDWFGTTPDLLVTSSGERACR